MYKDSNKQGLGGTDRNGKQKRFCLSNQPLELHSDDHTTERVDPKKADSPGISGLEEQCLGHPEEELVSRRKITTCQVTLLERLGAEAMVDREPHLG